MCSQGLGDHRQVMLITGKMCVTSKSQAAFDLQTTPQNPGTLAQALLVMTSACGLSSWPD